MGPNQNAANRGLPRPLTKEEVIRKVTGSLPTITTMSGRQFIEDPLAAGIIEFFKKTCRLKGTRRQSVGEVGCSWAPQWVLS